MGVCLAVQIPQYSNSLVLRPWVVPNGPNPAQAPREPVTMMPRGPPGYSSSSYTVHTHYSSHRRYSHSHSHSHSHGHSQPARPAVIVHHSSSPPAVLVHQSSKPPKTSSSESGYPGCTDAIVDRVNLLPTEPHRPHPDPVQHLLPVSSSGPGREHFFQYSKCTGKRKALCVRVFDT